MMMIRHIFDNGFQVECDFSNLSTRAWSLDIPWSPSLNAFSRSVFSIESGMFLSQNWSRHPQAASIKSSIMMDGIASSDKLSRLATRMRLDAGPKGRSAHEWDIGPHRRHSQYTASVVCTPYHAHHWLLMTLNLCQWMVQLVVLRFLAVKDTSTTC